MTLTKGIKEERTESINIERHDNKREERQKKGNQQKSVFHNIMISLYLNIIRHLCIHPLWRPMFISLKGGGGVIFIRCSFTVLIICLCVYFQGLHYQMIYCWMEMSAPLT